MAVCVFGWRLPMNHVIFQNHPTFYKITPANFLKELALYKICVGIDSSSVMNSINISCHDVPKKFAYENWNSADSSSTHQLEYLRAQNCEILLRLEMVDICMPCNKFRMRTEVEIRRKESSTKTPASLNAPITLTSPDRMKLTVQQHRQTIRQQSQKCGQLEEELKSIRSELERNSCNVTDDLHNDI